MILLGFYLLIVLINLILIEIYLKIRYKNCILYYTSEHHNVYVTLAILPIINIGALVYLIFSIIKINIKNRKEKK